MPDPMQQFLDIAGAMPSKRVRKAERIISCDPRHMTNGDAPASNGTIGMPRMKA